MRRVNFILVESEACYRFRSKLKDQTMGRRRKVQEYN